MPKNTTSTNGGAADSRKTRRAALWALAGALVALASAVNAYTLPDPVFAAIERHKAAYEVREATSFAINEVINDPEGREVSEAEWNALERAHKNENNAFDTLVTVTPETPAGMRAIIAHLICIDDGRLSQQMRRLLELLQKSPMLAS